MPGYLYEDEDGEGFVLLAGKGELFCQHYPIVQEGQLASISEKSF